MNQTRQTLSRREALLTLAATCAAVTHTSTHAMNSPTDTSTAVPAEVAAGLSKAQLLGRANLKFFGLLVYEARLWTAATFNAERYDSQPFALELEYARKLEGPAIAERSIAEMKRVGDFGDAQGKAWLAFMMQAFPNVGAQDRLTGVHDGKGQVRLSSAADAATALAAMAGAPAFLEGFVDFSHEVSVIAARGRDGSVAAYDPGLNVHREGILATSTVPATMSAASTDLARGHAASIAAALGYVGVLGVEFFVLADGSLLVNEIAPRVHNSGHWTQDACFTGQFEQHIRAIAGWPLAHPAPHRWHPPHHWPARPAAPAHRFQRHR